MSSFDLSMPFVALCGEQHHHNPTLRLETDLKQVNVVLASYATALGTTPEKLPILYVCVDSQHLHPNFIEHIEAQSGTDKYKGQHFSRLKKLIRNLLWPREAKGDEEPKPVILEEFVPQHLREVWFLLPRVNGRRLPGTPEDEYIRRRAALPLTRRGLALGLALLRVSNAHDVSDIKSLLEGKSNLIYLSIRSDNPRKSWHDLISSFCIFRSQVRDYLGYVIDEKTKFTLSLKDLPEPLQSQVKTYIDRARNGFQSSGEIFRLAKTKYDLELLRHSEGTIRNYLKNILFGLGYIFRELSIQVTDVRELLKLQARELEVDGILITELYNPLIDCYRSRGLRIVSDRKEVDFDTTTFRHFISGLAAIAAFNGFLYLRKLFLDEYTVTLDEGSKEKRKELKKKTFGRPWLNEQIQRLKLEFHQIVIEGSFKNKPGGALGPEARRNLNLCLFYVTLLSLRFIGVRQQSIRDCKLGENIIFASAKSVTFQWPTSKNGKGIRHRLNMKEHSDTHKDLIDALWTFYKKVYPYISGISADEQLLAVREVRRQQTEGQFFLCCAQNGLCASFNDHDHFYAWFTTQAQLHLDFDGVPLGIHFNPHFIRAMYGDWLRFDLGFSAAQTAEMAADSEEVFESEYISHPTIFDATEAWTRKNQEIRAARDGEGEKTKDIIRDEVIKRYEVEMASMRETIKSMAEAMQRLTDRP
jgi:hypothetical protein